MAVYKISNYFDCNVTSIYAYVKYYLDQLLELNFLELMYSSVTIYFF